MNKWFGVISLRNQVERWPEKTAGVCESPEAFMLQGWVEASFFLDFFFGSFLLYQDKRNEHPGSRDLNEYKMNLFCRRCQKKF
jgi:hypothetical protein